MQNKLNPSFDSLHALLGGISPEQFLEEYWHKKPLLIRGAIPNFQGIISPNELAGLACEEGVQSRLVSRQKSQWSCEDGPFSEKRFARLPKKDWSLLVQSVNYYLPEAQKLVEQFNFIPYARLDDLMVSFAPDGGGVGPHFDSYDVFLLQGLGQRLWKVSHQEDLSLVEDAPLRILKNFETDEEWTLSPGDMLYLPPHLAHWGIAVGECMTYSIGFRAPSASELASEFLNYLQENRTFLGRYQDPNLQRQQHPSLISPEMIDQVDNLIKTLSWDKQDIADFLGTYLTTPKMQVVFERPEKVSLSIFEQKIRQHGVVLDPKSQLLFSNEGFYLNGEKLSLPNDLKDWMVQLADDRFISPTVCNELPKEFIGHLFDWYACGYLHEDS
jgi:50S ribosomal protein L16 3-hydroxylase